jgi:pyruvate kinase
MLESMTKIKIPTRAEVSDVANAIYDFTDTIMLSAETASGKYPKEAVSVMTKIATFNEEKNRVLDIRNIFEYELLDQSQMVCDSAFNLYKALKTKNEKVKGFIVFTHTGKTARMLSRYRPHVPIFAFCPSESLTKQMTISFGVYPIFQQSLKQKSEIVKEDIKDALNLLIESDLAKEKDTFIVLHGDYWTSETGTSTIRLITI